MVIYFPGLNRFEIFYCESTAYLDAVQISESVWFIPGMFDPSLD